MRTKPVILEYEQDGTRYFVWEHKKNYKAERNKTFAGISRYPSGSWPFHTFCICCWWCYLIQGSLATCWWGLQLVQLDKLVFGLLYLVPVCLYKTCPLCLSASALLLENRGNHCSLTSLALSVGSKLDHSKPLHCANVSSL